MKKMKVVDKYVAIKALLNGEKAEMSVADALSFIDERIAITEKKNASGSNADRKPSAGRGYVGESLCKGYERGGYSCRCR